MDIFPFTLFYAWFELVKISDLGEHRFLAIRVASLSTYSAPVRSGFTWFIKLVCNLPASSLSPLLPLSDLLPSLLPPPSSPPSLLRSLHSLHSLHSLPSLSSYLPSSPSSSLLSTLLVKDIYEPKQLASLHFDPLNTRLRSGNQRCKPVPNTYVA